MEYNTHSKSFHGNFYEDFTIGQQITHGIPRTITEGDISLYTALTGHRFVLNCALPVAQACGFNRLPIDNLLLFHIAFGKTVPDISLNAVANLGYAECQFTGPAFVGDTVFVHSTILGLKQNSNGKTGIVYVHSKAVNQDNQTLLHWKRWVMVHKRSEAMNNAAPQIPEFHHFLIPDKEIVPDKMNLTQFDRQWSGQDYGWDDYGTGEIIDHIDGLTIDHSSHVMATQLYQNNAKVHFNQHQMQDSKGGQRLVYGGHIISLCRSISHNGLANALWLCAIHGGNHVNPSYAGDTIYARSQILDKGKIKGRDDMGWLRIKTWGIKNSSGEQIKQLVSHQDGKKLFDKQVVLELDYSVLMPT